MVKRLFVYGTLKQGYGNNILLCGAKFIGPAISHKKYVLFNCGFPVAVTLSEEHPMLPIIGEVYEVGEQHIKSCDQLEGHPNWYRRDEIKATILTTGEEVETDIYEMNDWDNSRLKCNIVNNIVNGAYEWQR